jgi:hypothetical protein
MDAVSVDRHFVRIGSKSYAVDRITSVEVRRHRPYSIGPAVAGFLSALLLLTLGIVRPVRDSWLAPTGAIGLGISLMFFALWRWQRARVEIHQLHLSPNFPPEPAFVARDRAIVIALRDRIEAAITERAGPGPDAEGTARRFMGTSSAPEIAMPGNP